MCIRDRHWRRCGRAGGCQIKWGCSSVGRAPALQAGGHEFESRYLHENMSRADRDETRVACESRERKVKHSQETYVYQYVP